MMMDNQLIFFPVNLFSTEMAERHDAKAVLKLSRELVLQIQSLMDNNYNWITIGLSVKFNLFVH